MIKSLNEKAITVITNKYGNMVRALAPHIAIGASGFKPLRVNNGLACQGS